jgi:hypothetical protein
MKIFFLVGTLCSLFCFVGGVDALEELPSGYSAREGVKMVEGIAGLFQRVIDGKQGVREFLNEAEHLFTPECSERLWFATLLLKQHCACRDDAQKFERSTKALTEIFEALTNYSGQVCLLMEPCECEVLRHFCLSLSLPPDKLNDAALPAFEELTKPFDPLSWSDSMVTYEVIEGLTKPYRDPYVPPFFTA